MSNADNNVFSGSVILPDRIVEHGYVACIGDTIAEVGEGIVPSRFDGLEQVSSRYIAPGFIDMHVHGGANADYMDGTESAVLTANRVHARHGTSVIFPTTTTGSFEELDAMVKACEAVRADWTPDAGSRIGGIHFYGPYFAEDKVGCHPVSGRRDPVKSEYEYFLSKDIVRIATCAAELEGALDFYTCARENGCYVTCGHSNASWEELDAAFNAGMRHVDHFWCAMSSVASLRNRFGMPMQAGMEQFVLMNRDMSTEVIADGEHLSDSLLTFAATMLGADRLCLVTDANRALDRPAGQYRFGHWQTGAIVNSDGRRVTAQDGGLASSMQGMDHMVKVMSRGSGAPLHEVVRMASLTPARLTGIAKRYGSLEVGKAADINLLGDNLDLVGTYLAGRVVMGFGND